MNPQAYNRYSYVVNSPINLNDPTGHAYCDFINSQNKDDCEGGLVRSQSSKTNGGKIIKPKDERDENTDNDLLENSSNLHQVSAEIPWWLQALSGIKIVLRNTPSSWWAETGRRLIQISRPHGGANYWHINSDLKALQFMNHANIEPILKFLGGIKIMPIIVPLGPIQDFFKERYPEPIIT
jgi:hypothetical protein